MDGDRGEDFGAAAPKFRLSTAPKPEPATLALGDKSDNRPLYRLHSARGPAQGNQRRRSRAVTMHAVLHGSQPHPAAESWSSR